GNKVVELAKAILRSPTWALTPAVSALDARGEHGTVRGYFLRGSRFALYLVLPIQIGLFIYGRSFLWLWLGPAYASASGPTMEILAATLSLTVAQSVASRVLYGIGRIRLFSRMALVEGVVNVLISVALVVPLGFDGQPLFERLLRLRDSARKLPVTTPLGRSLRNRPASRVAG